MAVVIGFSNLFAREGSNLSTYGLMKIIKSSQEAEKQDLLSSGEASHFLIRGIVLKQRIIIRTSSFRLRVLMA